MSLNKREEKIVAEFKRHEAVVKALVQYFPRMSIRRYCEKLDSIGIKCREEFICFDDGKCGIPNPVNNKLSCNRPAFHSGNCSLSLKPGDEKKIEELRVAVGSTTI